MNTPNRHRAYLRNLEAEYAPEAMQSEPINTHSLSQIRAMEILIRRRRGWGGDMVGSQALGSVQYPFVLSCTCFEHLLSTYSEQGLEIAGSKGRLGFCKEA